MIRTSHLTRQFDKRGIAGLHDLSFELPKGKIMGLVGPNGSGKTTLIKVLNGQIPPDSGEFTVKGDSCLFPSNHTVENINVQKLLINSVTLNVDNEKKMQLARDLADTFEFTFQLRQNLNELSCGQRQKVLLAKMLINRPSLLFLDEPFSHLDPFTRRDILHGLFQYIRQQVITVLWVTHDLEEVLLYSDVIALMNFGKIEQQGSPESLMTKPRNLFVAKFMGYRNFIPVKTENDLDAVLIVPDFAWEINPCGTAYHIEKRYPVKQAMEYVLSRDGKTWYFQQSAHVGLLDVGSQVFLSPQLDLCLTIPL